MNFLKAAKSCELHVHLGGCLSAENLLELGRDMYRDVDWSGFCDAYQVAFGTRPDPVALYQAALSGAPDGLANFAEHYVFSQRDGGDFGRFRAKYTLINCLARHWISVLNRDGGPVYRLVVANHLQEGVDFVEYRLSGGGETPEGFRHLHYGFVQELQEAAQHGIIARHIISLRRDAALEDYALVQYLLDQQPEAIPTVVGVDFSDIEEGRPPKILRPFFARLQHENKQRPERALEVVYHVGESYFDKSLESAVRWCHQAAELGARRLGHAIALGLDGAIAIGRRPDAHATEPASERLDQIAYDLEYSAQLASYGVEVDPKALAEERAALQKIDPDEPIHRPYNERRLREIIGRQQYVLDRLAQRGTIIECCPTSNLRIGGVPDEAHHPVHRFLDSQVNLVICADDPGIFGTTLADEVDWVLAHSKWRAEDLDKRLGDPRRFQLGSARSNL
ncbi:MAG: hypothetical protein GKR89_19310 [Candidatus Latescibacteria bacterium]|nr:hypothetical protein [Candidatus Latescibacterota bacterium]